MKIQSNSTTINPQGIENSIHYILSANNLYLMIPNSSLKIPIIWTIKYKMTKKQQRHVTYFCYILLYVLNKKKVVIFSWWQVDSSLIVYFSTCYKLYTWIIYNHCRYQHDCIYFQFFLLCSFYLEWRLFMFTAHYSLNFLL